MFPAEKRTSDGVPPFVSIISEKITPSRWTLWRFFERRELKLTKFPILRLFLAGPPAPVGGGGAAFEI